MLSKVSVVRVENWVRLASNASWLVAIKNTQHIIIQGNLIKKESQTWAAEQNMATNKLYTEQEYFKMCKLTSSGV